MKRKFRSHVKCKTSIRIAQIDNLINRCIQAAMELTNHLLNICNVFDNILRRKPRL